MKTLYDKLSEAKANGKKYVFPVIMDNVNGPIDPEMNYNLYMLAHNAHFWWTFSLRKRKEIYDYIRNHFNLMMPGLDKSDFKIYNLFLHLNMHTLIHDPYYEYLTRKVLPPNIAPGHEDEILKTHSCDGNQLVADVVNKLLKYYPYDEFENNVKFKPFNIKMGYLSVGANILPFSSTVSGVFK